MGRNEILLGGRDSTPLDTLKYFSDMYSSIYLVTPPQPQPQEEWNNAASQVAKVLADAISAVETDTTITVTNNSNSIKLQGKGTEASSLLPPPSSSSSSLPPSKATTTSTNENNTNGTVSHHEPVTENRDGVEWVSFVYSHHRILRRYCIRTDLDKVDISQLDEKFKRDNCVSNAALYKSSLCERIESGSAF